MAEKQLDLKKAATDVVATIAGKAAGAAAVALDVPPPLAVLVAQLGEEKAAEVIEWLLAQAEEALRRRVWPDAIEVSADRVTWTDRRPVQVQLSGRPHFVQPGTYVVQQLKARLHVPHDDLLVKVLHRPAGDGHRSVLELDDNAGVTVNGGEIFESRRPA